MSAHVDFLRLPNVVTKKVKKELDGDGRTVTVVEADYQCGKVWEEEPCCGRRPHKNQRRKKILMGVPIGGIPVRIHLSYTQYKCPVCKKYYVPLDHHVMHGGKMTMGLREHIICRGLQIPLATLSKQTGVSASSISKILDSAIYMMDALYQKKAYRVICIDDAHPRNKRLFAISAHETGKIIEVTKGSSGEDVANAIDSLANPEGIEVICIDMSPALRSGIQISRANPIVVVDKFHAFKAVRDGMNVIRKKSKKMLLKKVGKKIREISAALNTDGSNLTMDQSFLLKRSFEACPDLKLAYEIKERFSRIYKANNSKDAARLYCAWWNSIPEGMKSVFKKAGNIRKDWWDEFLAYFDTAYFVEENGKKRKRYVTNGLAESMNSLIKQEARALKGIHFHRFRARILFKYGIWGGEEILSTIGPLLPALMSGELVWEKGELRSGYA